VVARAPARIGGGFPLGSSRGAPADLVGFAAPAPAPASASDVVARCVEAHPTQPLFLAGTASGSLVLWRFGPESARDGFVAAFDVDARESPDEPSRPRSRHAEVRAACWSPRGARFAAGTSAGALALWRADADPLDARGGGAAPVAFRAAPRPDARVEAAAFLSPAVVAAAGSRLAHADGGGNDAGSVVAWDTLAPPRSAPAAAVAAHEGGATALVALGGSDGTAATPGHSAGAAPWPVIATGGRAGDVAAHDLRMLGGRAGGTVLWRARPDGGGGGGEGADAGPRGAGAAGGEGGALAALGGRRRRRGGGEVARARGGRGGGGFRGRAGARLRV
jgi:hypothetical protein